MPPLVFNQIMKKQILHISEGQHLTDIYAQIATNTILCKTLPGLGATYSEIKADRDSIIVVPNIPPISGKCKKHRADNLFGVKENITIEDISDYLTQTLNDGKHIKLISTPESFYKIKEAFRLIEEDMYSRCFLLMDECHKLVKDRDYRPDILLPMNDFFMFIEKALVSATPIIPSDPRFEENHFTITEVRPDFDFRHDIQLVHTNNILETLRQLFPEMKKQHPDTTMCIFANSTDMIHQLINKLGIVEQSSVFCSDKSVAKLKGLGFKNAHPDWDENFRKEYNFFTSRFYTALDIEMKDKPDVVFLTEPYFAEFTMLDQLTDAVQAIGRFRNGVNSVTHFLATKNSIEQRTNEGIREYLKGLEKAHTIIRTIRDSTKSKELRASYDDTLKALPYNQFLSGGYVDYFAIDNYIDDELVKSSYYDIESVKSRYEDSGYFNVISTDSFSYSFGEKERLSLYTNTANNKEMRKQLVEVLDNIKDDRGTEMIDHFIEELKEKEPVIVEAFFTLGMEVVEQCNYRISLLKEKLLVNDFNKKRNGTQFLEALRNSFKVGEKYTLKFEKAELIRLYAMFDINTSTGITAKTLKEYFQVDDKARIKNAKALRILSAKI